MTVPKRTPIQPLRLEGDAYQRGLIHGETLHNQIQELVRIWMADLSTGFRSDAEQVIRRFLQQTDFLPSIEKWTPDLLEEVRGIADGSGLSFDTALAFQLLDEMWAWGETAAGEQCTSIGLRARAGDPTCVAQNIDVERFRHGFQVVLHCIYPGSDLEAFVVTSTGVIGYNGMNNRGIGVCCNALPPLNGRREGLPVACIVRGVLTRSSAQDACKLLQRVSHASPQNYLVGGPDSVYDLECSANQVAQYRPQGWEDAVWHANLPLVNDDSPSGFRQTTEEQEANPFLRNNRARFRCVETRLRQAPRGARLEFLKEVLASRDSDQDPICSTGRASEFFTGIGIYSFASTIMKLSGTPELHVTFSPADASSYTRLALTAQT